MSGSHPNQEWTLTRTSTTDVVNTDVDADVPAAGVAGSRRKLTPALRQWYSPVDVDSDVDADVEAGTVDTDAMDTDGSARSWRSGH